MLAAANACSSVGQQNKIGRPVRRHRQFLQIAVSSACATAKAPKRVIMYHNNESEIYLRLDKLFYFE